MYALATFRDRVKELCRQSYPYEDERNATLTDLAAAIGLARAELSRRLNGATGCALTEHDSRAIVRALASWGTISTQAEALELLNLVSATPFTSAEWHSPPLDLLIPIEYGPGSSPIAAKTEPKSNLPAPLSSFVGRERERQEVAQLTTQTRLLTLIGAGGVGKTRLALEVAAFLTNKFPDGIFLIELASTSDPQLVAQVLATTLLIRERLDQPLVTAITQALAEREMLLVLDNCEHLLTAVAETSHQLLTRCPKLRILATSRERLRVEGEAVWQVPPLSIPPADTKLNLRSLTQYEAVRLFIERAKAVRPGLKLNTGNATAIADICQRLDGIPLAIELAAAGVAAISVEELRARLRDHFALLESGLRTAPHRHQTLQAVVDWSYELLTADQGAMFCRLGVFAGSFSLDAAEQVCADEYIVGYSALDLITGLVSKSLVERKEEAGASHYQMLETIREYALQQLEQRGEAQIARESHARYYLRLAEQAETELEGEQQSRWYLYLETVLGNLRAALTWLLGSGDGEAALRLAAAVRQFWLRCGHLAEGRAWLEAGLQHNEVSDLGVRAKALYAQGELCWGQGDYNLCADYYRDSLALSRQLGDKQALARTLNSLGMVITGPGNYAAAKSLLEESLTLARALGDNYITAQALGTLARIAREQGDATEAMALLEVALPLARQLVDKYPLSRILNNLAIGAVGRGDFGQATAYYEEALNLWPPRPGSGSRASAHSWLGLIALYQSDFKRAAHLFHLSLSDFQLFGSKRGVALCLAGLAEVAVAGERWALAAQLTGAAAALTDGSGVDSSLGAESFYVPLIGSAPAALGEAEFAAAWSIGHNMTLAEAVNFALNF